MIANVLTDFFIDDFVEGDFNEKSFVIEVHQNYVTVDRKHQHTSLIESKTIKIDKDVIVYLHEKKEDIVDLECKWLWRDPTYYENLSRTQAEDLKSIILQLSQAQRNVSLSDVEIKGIRVGNQIWSSENIDLDMGVDSRFPVKDDTILEKHSRLYSFKAVENITNLFTEWRLPTVKDYEELIDFFGVLSWEELTKRMDFKLSGFYSSRIPKKELIMFLKMNRALRSEYGGFYWTADIEDYDYRNKQSGKRNYVYFNKYSQKISIEQSVNENNNLFSLRLIRK